MKTLYVLLFIALGAFATAQINVTFQVDMSSETVSADGVHIAGSLNGWNTSSTMLTDPDGDDIYEVTMQLDADADYEYKYLNGNVWGTEETPPMACAVGGNNRIFTTGSADMTLPLIPFGDCPMPNPTQDVTFTVDMRGETISPDGIYIAGNFNGWNPSSTQMTPIGNDFYEITYTVLSSITTVQYKYLNGSGWGNEETVPAACANGSTNRFYDIEGLGSPVLVPGIDFGTCTPSSFVVPVTLSRLAAVARSGAVVVDWATSAEINNKGFEIQRSRDGRDWSVVGFVEGYGTTNEPRVYQFVDNRPSSGANYYRLRQVDLDGQYEYTYVVSAQLDDKGGDIAIYPNPVGDEFTISQATGQMTIYDIQGRPVLTRELTQDQETITASDLPSGTYILSVTRIDGSIHTSTFVK